MTDKKNMTVEIKQTAEGSWIIHVKTGFRKNETLVAETVDSLLDKVKDKISKFYKGYSAS